MPERARTIVLTATFTGLRKSELRGLTWGSYNGEQLSVEPSVWNSTVSEPKTKRSRSPIPVVRPLAEALEARRLRAGILAQSNLPIFQAGNGKPLNLDNIARRVIMPALSTCAICGEQESEHLPADGHDFQRDKALPVWHGWHAFRRGLHTLGISRVQSIFSDQRLSRSIFRFDFGVDTLAARLSRLTMGGALQFAQ